MVYKYENLNLERYMSCFWAKFQLIEEHLFRFDTRIYLTNIIEPKEDDLCVGAIVGKNPGSAKQSASSNELQAIKLDGDKLLPTVRNIITSAYSKAQIIPPDQAYIQVLNLFYLCNPNLACALETINNIGDVKPCSSEFKSFPWIWYVWGDSSSRLSPYKKRFSCLDSPNHFFYDNQVKEVKCLPPSLNEFAKHTQGLKHEYVIPYIANLIKKALRRF